jgi:hypothetical protein
VTFNSFLFNSTVFNGIQNTDSDNTFVGNLLTLEQDVLSNFEGQLLAITQSVDYSATFSGQLLELSQAVTGEYVGRLINIEQLVFETNEYNFFQRNGYYPILLINGARIPDSWIHGEIVVDAAENESRQLTFTLMPPKGLQPTLEYVGAAVVVANYDLVSGVQTMFTGVINTPDYDILEGKTTFYCSDLREEKINAGVITNMPFIGYYLPSVFGQAGSLAEELEQRLSTTTGCVDFDRFGVPFYTDSLPLGTPHFSYTSSQLYREGGLQPKIKLLERTQVVNNVTINLTYQYPRLYHRKFHFTWNGKGGDSGDICDFLQNGYSMASKAMISQAAVGAGWPLASNISFGRIMEGGWYRCEGSLVGFVNNPTSGGTAIPKRDADGNLIQNNDNTVYTTNNNQQTNRASDAYASSAGWDAATQFSQNIEERYTILITAPQSVAQFGSIGTSETIAISSDLDTSTWDDFKAFAPPPPGFLVNGADRYADDTSKLLDLYQAFYIGYFRARSKIIRSHRNYEITFTVPLAPYVELYHTVSVSGVAWKAGSVSALGKVKRIRHRMSLHDDKPTTTITIAFSKSIGNSFDTPVVFPLRPSYTPPPPDPPNPMGSVYGQNPPPNFTGFVGNKYVNKKEVVAGKRVTNYTRTTLDESFTVKVPEIAAIYRNTQILQGTGLYFITIPDYPLATGY